MKKKISMLALAGLIALPGVAAASAGKTPTDLDQRIEELSRQLDELKAQLAKQNEDLAQVGSQVEDMDEQLAEKSPAWDLAARFKWYGDFRARLDYMTSSTADQYTVNQVTQGFAMALASPPPTGFGAPGPYSYDMIRAAVQGFQMYTPQQRAALFQMMGLTPVPSQDVDNDTMMTNRLRLNMDVQATENVSFKGRLAMYKAWGMQSNPAAPFGSPFTLDGFQMDGNSTRQPDDNALRVDRAYFNWTNIASLPIWLSIGRRPSTDGPPAHLRMGNDERMGTPIAFMNYPLDGAILGYGYEWGNQDFGVGRLRFCYGRGFEDGLSTNQLNDMDFAGINWDIMQSGHRLLNLQAFEVFNIINTPDGVTFPNPLEMAGLVPGNGILDKAQLGNIYHTSLIYMDKIADLNWFVAGAWSRTDPEGYDELGNSLLGNWWSPLENEDGYALYAGVRYDIDDLRLKLGLEYNYGSQYWISMTPGHDDLYNAKLATRGHVGEVYMIYDLMTSITKNQADRCGQNWWKFTPAINRLEVYGSLLIRPRHRRGGALPTGEAISRYAKTFMRLGYQYYKYNYTGSGSWLGAPVDVDDLAGDPLNAQFFPALDDMSQVYLTFDIYF